MLRVVLAILVWRKLITLKVAKRIIERIGDRESPANIEDCIKEIEEAIQL